MPGFIDTIKKQTDTLDKAINPFRKVDDVTRDEAIARGKTITVDDRIKKIP